MLVKHLDLCIWSWNSLSVTIQMKATEQFFPVSLFVFDMLYKVVLTFVSMG